MRSKVDLAEAAFSDQAAEGVIADRAEVGRGELCEQRLVGVGKLGAEALVSSFPSRLRCAMRCDKGVYLFPLVLQLVLGMRPGRWHMRAP